MEGIVANSSVVPRYGIEQNRIAGLYICFANGGSCYRPLYLDLLLQFVKKKH